MSGNSTQLQLAKDTGRIILKVLHLEQKQGNGTGLLSGTEAKRLEVTERLELSQAPFASVSYQSE